MLILTRRASESIVIDGRIVVTVVRIDHSAVKLGINAPPDMAIHRQEVHDAIQRGEPLPSTRREQPKGPQQPRDDTITSE